MSTKLSSDSPFEKLTLHGFNNLTKNLAISVYKTYYSQNLSDQHKHLDAINQQFSPTKLNDILSNICQLIGANVLNVAQQAYQPQGASVTMMIADGDHENLSALEQSNNANVVAHLDKSHLCVHSYPESHPNNGLSTIRIDFELSTCGVITPLHAVNYLIEHLDADLISLDYRVRGFTRGVKGEKYYLDHDISSIQEYLSQTTIKKYISTDMNNPKANLFFTQLKKRELTIEQHVLAEELSLLSAQDKGKIKEKINAELNDLFAMK